MFETQTLPSLGPWLSNCRNVILTAHSPCWPGLDITLTVYFCTTCTEKNILCKQEQRAPQAKGVTQFTMHCMARGEGRTTSVKLQITLFGAVTFARKLTSCYCSHLASLWLVRDCQYLTLICLSSSWVSEEDSRKEWGESRVQKHVCLDGSDQS